MKKCHLLNALNFLLALLFCLLLYVYTMAFPGNTSWFLFIFFGCLFLLLLLTTLFYWGKSTLEAKTETEGASSVRLQIKRKSGLPILLPALSLRLGIKGSWTEMEVSAAFHNKVEAVFPPVHFPRGRHTSAVLETAGKDFFGFFAHCSRTRLPASLDVYPIRLSEKESRHFHKALAAQPSFRQQFYQEPDQFWQLREYQPQDPLKQVDWKMSAKKQKIMLREYESAAPPVFTVIFLGSASPSFEKLLSLAYTLYLDLQQQFSCALKLLGNYEGQPGIQTDAAAFLTVEPEADFQTLKTLWQPSQEQNRFGIVIGSEKILSQLQPILPDNCLFFSEKDFVSKEVGS